MEDARNRRRYVETDGRGWPVGLKPLAKVQCIGCGEIWMCGKDANKENNVTFQLVKPDPHAAKHDHRFEVVKEG
jgi:hypothetical protein